MPDRLDVLKTYKLYIDGKFPRTESGRSMIVTAGGAGQGRVVAHACKASRKDLRDAVEAARKAQPGWAGTTAYNRGQVLYRIAEMMEGKRGELAEAIAAVRTGPLGSKRTTAVGPRAGGPHDEVAAAIDRFVYYAGWADKYAQVLGCNNPVSGPYYNFTIPEPTGVVAVLAPDERPLLALVSLLAPVICSGNAAIVVASQLNPIPGAVMGEVFATSDVPAGVVNVLTGERDELLPHVTTHRDIDGICAADLAPAGASAVRLGVAENIKRVKLHEAPPPPLGWLDAAACHSPWWIEPFVEFKTVWHPASV